MNKLWKKIVAVGLVLVISMTAFAAIQAASHRIFTIGDSTVQDYNDGWAPRKGWGQMLQSFFYGADVEVINRAVGGTSSKSFYNSFWSGVKGEMRSGDFVFIQFGINDRNRNDPNRGAYGDEFKGYLKNYVNEARAMGAIPVLVSTVRRISWSNGAPYDSYHEHPQLVREVAAELNVPLIDLDTKHKNGMVEVGQLYSERMWSNSYVPGEYPNYQNGNTDQVHFQEMGAIQLADFVVEGILELSNDANVSKLIPFIKPQYEIQVLYNHPEAGTVTRTQTYPSGLNIHLKALTNSGHNFINWKDNAGNVISTNNIIQFTSGSSNQTYVAYFDDENPFNIDCNGDVNGTASLDDCGICSGGNTGVTACTAFVQGEAACEVDGILLESSNAGFGGDGYVNTDNVLGAGILWNLFSAQEQEVEFTFRFANGGAIDRNMSVLLNGNAGSDIEFPTTGSFTTWAKSTTTLSLKKGSNILELTALTDGGGPNIDVLTFDVEGVALGSCGEDCNGDLYGGAYLDDCNTCVEGNTGKEACEQDCEGNWGGTAYIDDCEICVGTINTTPCTGSIEAETACSVDGIQLEADNPGFSGEGYVNTSNVLGSYASWVINSNSAHTATFSFRFANGGATARDGVITVNDVPAGDLLLPSTGTWQTWEFATVEIPLEQGANEIVVTANSTDGLANLDLIALYSDEVSDAQCGLITVITQATSSSLEVYPNPVGNTLHLSFACEWTLESSTGNVLSNGNGTEINTADLQTGIYLLKVGNEVFKVIKE